MSTYRVTDSTLGLPWRTMQPGDVVEISYRAEPYRDTLPVVASGLTLRGIPGPNGERPIFDGRGAAMSQVPVWNQERGLVNGSGAWVHNETGGPIKGLTIENIAFRGARSGEKFSGGAWMQNAAALYLAGVTDLIIRNCEISDSEMGLYLGSVRDKPQWYSRNVLVEDCFFHDLGQPGGGQVHASYTEAVGITFRRCRFVQPPNWSSALKSRDAGLTVESCWFDGGDYCLDLVNSHLLPAYPTAGDKVTGCVLIKRADAGNDRAINYGWDTEPDKPQMFRRHLEFEHNTVIGDRAGNLIIFRLSNPNSDTFVQSSVIYCLADSWAKSSNAGTPHDSRARVYNGMDVVEGQGKAYFDLNWIQRGYSWYADNPKLGLTRIEGNVRQNGNIFGDEPGIDLENYAPLPGSILIEKRIGHTFAGAPAAPVTTPATQTTAPKGDTVTDLNKLAQAITDAKKKAADATAAKTQADAELQAAQSALTEALKSLGVVA